MQEAVIDYCEEPAKYCKSKRITEEFYEYLPNIDLE